MSVTQRLPRTRAYARGAGATAVGAFLVAFVDGGCSSQSFDPSNEVESVRVLAIRADPPFAPPGATVTIDMLAADGRPTPTPPVSLAWLPEPCINPANDAYYACFPGFAGKFVPGADLAGQLQAGTRLSIALPGDIIAAHATPPGQGPYGVAVVFAVACAGHLEYRPELGAGSPNAIPFGCFNSAENRLGPDDFVFAFASIYSFTDRTNTNPQIDSVTADGATVDADAGFTLSRCSDSNLRNCPATSLDVSVPASSQELNPGSLDRNGYPLKEEIWVDYYVTGTQTQNDAVVLYDPAGGALANKGNGLYGPRTTDGQHLWAVVHDDRGGVNWLQIPFRAH